MNCACRHADGLARTQRAPADQKAELNIASNGIYHMLQTGMKPIRQYPTQQACPIWLSNVPAKTPAVLSEGIGMLSP